MELVVLSGLNHARWTASAQIWSGVTGEINSGAVLLHVSSQWQAEGLFRWQKSNHLAERVATHRSRMRIDEEVVDGLGSEDMEGVALGGIA